MNKKVWFISLIGIFLLGIYGIYKYYAHVSWYQYALKTLNDPPRPLIKKALEIIDTPVGIAIDFGSSCGNESAYLLQKGYTTIAIDKERKALELLRSRDDVQHYISKLQTIVSSFEDIQWNTLPQVHLFVASVSLPFIHPDTFKNIWNNIVAKILPGGYFVGHFFTPDFGILDEKTRQQMTFLPKSSIEALFKGFLMVTMNHVEEEWQTNIGPVNANYYEVIARKN